VSALSVGVAMRSKKPIISPSQTDANSIISPRLIIEFASVREIISPASYIYGMVAYAQWLPRLP